MLTITTDSHSHDIHGARYACPWRHPVSGRPCRNHIGERGGEQRRALALGLLILRAQRREAKRERFLAGHDALSTDGRTCLRCNLPVGQHTR